MPLSPPERVKQRRRVLQAAVGAPVIFTLPSGAALAAASLSCQDKSAQLRTSQGAAGVTSATDTWIRYRLPQYSFKAKNLSTHQSLGTVNGFTFNSKWYIVQNGDAVEVELNGNGSYTATGSNYYALVDYSKYSPTANPTSYVYPSATPVASPVAGASCWNSLLATSLTANVIN